MFIDQEIASIINFVLGAAPKGVAPYYYRMNEDFAVPSIFFPPPEFEAHGDTLASYKFDFTWFIPVFAKDDAEALSIAHSVANALMTRRRLVPLIGENGKTTKKGLRLNDPDARTIDKEGVCGTAQLTLRWSSRRPYDEEEAQKMMEFTLNFIDPERGAQPPQTGQ